MITRKITLAAAALVALSGTAYAGGFSYKSYGGNHGTFSYHDAAAGGDSNCVGIGACVTTSTSDAGAYSSSGKKGYKKSYSAGSAYSTNTSAAVGLGIVKSQSGSSALVAGGTGYGSGYKGGYAR